MIAARVAIVAATLAALATAAAAQDAGVAPPPDAGPIVVDGPELLGIARPQASAAAAPSRVRLGDTFTLFIDVIFDEQVTVNLPSTLDLGDSFDEVKRTSGKDEVRTDGTRKRTYQIQLRPWELGELRLPPFQVGYTVGGQRSWVVTNAVPIEVIGQLGDVDDKTALLDDTPPVPIESRDWRWAMVAAAAAAVIVVAVIARRLRRRPLAPAMIVATTTAGGIERPRLSGPAERALAALDELDRAGTLVSAPRDGYDELVAILRRFVHDQFGVAIHDRTTDELLAALARTSISRSALVAARAWFARCDLVKYAAERPDAAHSRGDLDAGRALVIEAAGGAPRREGTAA